MQKLAHRHVSKLVCVLLLLLSTYFGTNDKHGEHTELEPVEGCEEGAKEVMSSEAKVIVADLLCGTLHSFWRCFHSCPPISTRSTLSTIPSFVRSRLSFSFFFSRTHTPSFLVFPLSPRINPCQPSLITHCIMINQTRRPILACAAPFSLPHPRCLILAASSSLPHPCCLILAASSSLPYPCCLILTALPSLHRSRSNFSS